jgi:hypothetical protein
MIAAGTEIRPETDKKIALRRGVCKKEDRMKKLLS